MPSVGAEAVVPAEGRLELDGVGGPSNLGIMTLEPGHAEDNLVVELVNDKHVKDFSVGLDNDGSCDRVVDIRSRSIISEQSARLLERLMDQVEGASEV